MSGKPKRRRVNFAGAFQRGPSLAFVVDVEGPATATRFMEHPTMAEAPRSRSLEDTTATDGPTTACEGLDHFDAVDDVVAPSSNEDAYASLLSHSTNAAIVYASEDDRQLVCVLPSYHPDRLMRPLGKPYYFVTFWMLELPEQQIALTSSCTCCPDAVIRGGLRSC